MTQLTEVSAAQEAAIAGADATALPRRSAHVRTRLAAIVASHTVVDVYSAFLPPLLGVMEVRCHLSKPEAAWLLGIGSLTSGLSQPLAAWLSDKLDSRVAGAVGLALAAVCLCSIGLANSFWTLVPLFALGMIGSGIFHPTGAASMGQMAGRRRSLGIGVFHVAGMIGGIIGVILVTRITGLQSHDGFALLRWLMIPGVLLAVALHLAIRRMPHRHHAHRAAHIDATESRQRWRAVWLLFAANAIRFTVNMILVYLFVRWAQMRVVEWWPKLSGDAIAAAAAPIIGNLNAFLMVGMAIGGVSAGSLVKQGREKGPMVWIAIVVAPAIALFPFVGLHMAYLLAVLCGLGFAGMIPITISLAQRLLPHRTSLASGLMLGGAWTLAFIGPRAAEWCLSTLGLSQAATFALTAGLLAASGIVCMGLDRSMLRRVATHD